MLKPHDRIFIRLDITPECDGRMDIQRESLWLLQQSALRAMWMLCKNITREIPECPLSIRFLPINTYFHTIQYCTISVHCGEISLELCTCIHHVGGNCKIGFQGQRLKVKTEC